MKNSGKCYRCGGKVTSQEHVPPKCLFPALKDLGVNFRKNLIKVPSCDEHNSQKSDDDEFLLIALAGSARGNFTGFSHFFTKGVRALTRKHEGFFDQILKDSKNASLVDENNNVLPTLVGRMNVERLNRCFENIAYGLFFHEFGEVYKGRIQLMNGFSEKETKNHKSLLELIDTAFENDKKKREEKGENKEVFFYQFTDPDEFGLISLRCCFYGNLYVYIALMPEGSKMPYHLGIDLMNKGIKTIFKVGNKNIEFN